MEGIFVSGGRGRFFGATRRSTRSGRGSSGGAGTSRSVMIDTMTCSSGIDCLIPGEIIGSSGEWPRHQAHQFRR